MCPDTRCLESGMILLNESGLKFCSRHDSECETPGVFGRCLRQLVSCTRPMLSGIWSPPSHRSLSRGGCRAKQLLAQAAAADDPPHLLAVLDDAEDFSCNLQRLEGVELRG